MSDTYEAVKRLREAYKLNPAAVQAWAIKLAAKLFIVGTLCFVSYLQGRSGMKDHYEAQIATQQSRIDKLNAANAMAAAQRTTERSQENVRIAQAVQEAKDEVHEFYAKNPVNPRIVETTKLVPVPGKPEYVYVPDGTCPNDFFAPDELRLWNNGRKGFNPNLVDPK